MYAWQRKLYTVLPFTGNVHRLNVEWRIYPKFDVFPLLTTECQIKFSVAYKFHFPGLCCPPGEVPKVNTCFGIWDTGATGSAITKLTAQKLNLAPTGKKRVSGLGGTVSKNVYLVDILLPNEVNITDLSVTEIDNPQDELGNTIDNFGVLVGMDIITRGDFTITHVGGKTIMTFRMPSIQKVDYVDEWNRKNAVQQRYRRGH